MDKKWNYIINNNGFTLIEVMIVIAIIGILAAIAVPGYTTYRKRAHNSMSFSTAMWLRMPSPHLMKISAAMVLSDDTQTLINPIGGSGAGNILLGSNGAIIAATRGTVGAMVTGSHPNTRCN